MPTTPRRTCTSHAVPDRSLWWHGRARCRPGVSPGLRPRISASTSSRRSARSLSKTAAAPDSRAGKASLGAYRSRSGTSRSRSREPVRAGRTQRYRCQVFSVCRRPRTPSTTSPPPGKIAVIVLAVLRHDQHPADMVGGNNMSESTVRRRRDWVPGPRRRTRTGRTRLRPLEELADPHQAPHRSRSPTVPPARPAHPDEPRSQPPSL